MIRDRRGRLQSSCLEGHHCRPAGHLAIDWLLLLIRFKLRDHSGELQLVVVFQSPGKAAISPIPANGQGSLRCRFHNYSSIVLKFDSHGKHGGCV